MAGSLGELVLKVSAPADRFKRDFTQMSGTANQFAGNAEAAGKRVEGAFAKMGGGRGLLGSVGQGFMQGLGIGSAIQGVSMLTREIGKLVRELGLAAIEGKNVGDAFDKWLSNKVGLKGRAEMFDEARARAKSIGELEKELSRDVARAGGAKDFGGQGQLDAIDKRIQELDKRRAEINQRINNGINFGKTGQLKAERALVTTDMQRLEKDRSKFIEEFAAATKAKAAQDALNESRKRGIALAESLRTPQQQFNASVTDTLKLLEVGAINWQTYERAVRAAGSELTRASEVKETMEKFSPSQGVGAVQRGTTAGFSAVQSAIRSQNDLARQQQAQAAKELAEAKQTNLILRQVEAHLRSGRNTPQVAEI